MVVIDCQEVHHVVPPDVIVHSREQEIQEVGHAAAEADAVETLESIVGKFRLKVTTFSCFISACLIHFNNNCVLFLNLEVKQHS